MKHHICYLFLTCVLFLTFCTKMDHTYAEFLDDGERVYSPKPKSVKCFPGKNRLLMKTIFKSTSNLSHITINHINGEQLSKFEVLDTEHEQDSVVLSHYVNDLQEGNYTFQIFSIDNDGNSSIAYDVSAEVFGDKYTSSLKTKPIKNTELRNDTLHITWFNFLSNQMSHSEIYYKTKNEEVHKKKLPKDILETALYNSDGIDSLWFRTAYLPSENAIDTFYSPYLSFKPQ